MYSKRLLIVDNRVEYFITHRMAWAQAARRAGYDVHVTTLTAGDSQAILDAGFHYHTISSQGRSANPLTEAGLLFRLYRLLDSLRPDLAHFITLRSVLYGSSVARIAGTPAVLNSITGLGFLFIDDTLKTKVLRRGITQALHFALGHCNQVTAFQNPDDANVFISQELISEEETVLIPGSGVDPKRFMYVSEEVEKNQVPIVMFPARLLWHKGVGEFVSAARELKASRADARFVLVGNTDPENPAAVPTEQVRAWQEDGVVEWWGHQEDMSLVLRQAHIVCLPSYREGLPKVLIEAASCGRPIITSDVPGCREVVNYGENGFVVPPQDVTALVEHTHFLLCDASLRQEMGRQGRKRVEDRFATQHIVEATVGTYDRLLSQVN